MLFPPNYWTKPTICYKKDTPKIILASIRTGQVLQKAVFSQSALHTSNDDYNKMISASLKRHNQVISGANTAACLQVCRLISCSFFSAQAPIDWHQCVAGPTESGAWTPFGLNSCSSVETTNISAQPAGNLARLREVLGMASP